MKYLIIAFIALMANAGDFKVEKDLAKNLFLSLESTVTPDCIGKKCVIELDQILCTDISKRTKCRVGAYSNGDILLKTVKGSDAQDIFDALNDINEATCSSDGKTCGTHFYNVTCEEKSRLVFKFYKCHLSDLRK
ncbi:hypothetical protein M902_2863 [Bacteriovorax sp. BAL6_X]|uniref:hypothetical protein n=1 Tax=Bacteriovorax sp. BAL6_X TaxID=1201290 RepID=UPI000385B102|nr:hypothetical protein [Bacteriovorax sp. BAL6_X]EPZ51022.1 hypothetical protein M902_2863 [Bacteriovorax sp. BAL6_X]